MLNGTLELQHSGNYVVGIFYLRGGGVSNKTYEVHFNIIMLNS